MQKVERFTIQHPIDFGFVLVLLFLVLSTLTWPITQIQTSPQGYEIGTAIAKMVIAACFILLSWRFGWLKTAGFSSLGPKQIWVLVIMLVIYRAIIGIYAFTASFQLMLPSIELTLAILFCTFATSLVEETMYRGLMLTSMVKAWGNTRGLYAAAILSGLFWASMHLFNLIVHPFPLVALQVPETTVAGFVYAAIVLSSSSIWPVIMFHWLINATVKLQVSQMSIFDETVFTWVIFILVALPMMIVGHNLLRKVTLKRKSDEEEPQIDKLVEVLMPERKSVPPKALFCRGLLYLQGVFRIAKISPTIRIKRRHS